MKRYGQKAYKSWCTGKARYRDLQQAQFEIDRAKQFRGETLRAYVCKRCDGIHLTSMSIEEFEKRRRH